MEYIRTPLSGQWAQTQNQSSSTTVRLKTQGNSCQRSKCKVVYVCVCLSTRGSLGDVCLCVCLWVYMFLLPQFVLSSSNVSRGKLNSIHLRRICQQRKNGKMEVAQRSVEKQRRKKNTCDRQNAHLPKLVGATLPPLKKRRESGEREMCSHARHTHRYTRRNTP